MSATTDTQFQQRMQRIETLLQQAERFPDDAARATTRELVQTLMDLHGAGFAAILDKLHNAGDVGRHLLSSLAADPLVASLLLLYGLHPVDLATRVRAALETLGPSLRDKHAEVELLGVEAGIVRLRLTETSVGISSAITLRALVEQTLYDVAPDMLGLEIAQETRGVEPSRFTLPLMNGHDTR